ncbi:MAG TPA: HTH domain-containing protein [Bacteroidia bacterium]|nr:HTH domain-containing protein [Bacteroidia bacterium]
MNGTIRATGMSVEINSSKIANIGRVERILKLIVYLNQWRSIAEIASHVQVSKKSVHRYTQLLTRLGFEIERGHRKYIYYRITNTKQFFGC